MSKTQRILGIFLSVLLCISLIALPVFAAEEMWNGLTLTFTTDQEAYQTGDPITASLSVTNGNSTAVMGLTFEAEAPSGYTLASTDGSAVVDSLPAGETAVMSLLLTAEESTTPESNPQQDAPAASPSEAPSNQPEAPENSAAKSPNLWWLLLLIIPAAVIGIGICKKWFTRHSTMMLFLCAALLITVLPPTAKAEQENTLTLTHKITVNGTPVTLTARVSCDPVKYTVTVVQGEGSGEYYPGETVTVEAYTYDEEYLFSGWAGEGITFGDLTSEKTEFVMPAADVTVTACYYVPKHTVTVVGGTGSGRYTPGDIVTITADTPEAGMIFAGWDAIGIELADPSAETTSFTMPNGDVEISAKFQSEAESWLIPCSYIQIIKPYGYIPHPLQDDPVFHQGIDLGAPEGTPIYATRSGTVTFAGYDVSPGNYVLINHGDGYQSIYMHMTNYTVQTGASVTQGQIIGYVGSTGMSTGPHLHFGIRYQGHYLNPANFVPLY